MKNEVYLIEGMSCAACSAAVERVTRKLDGVESSSVNLTTNKMNIVYDETKVTEQLIEQKVVKAGFGIKKFEAEKQEPEKKEIIDEEILKNKMAKRNIFGAAILSALLLYISMGQMIFENIPMPNIIDINNNPSNYALTQLLLTIPVLYIGRKFFIGGFKALVHLNPNMDSLVAIGSGSAFIYSIVMVYLIPANVHHVHHLYFESSAVIITFIMLGKYLESKSKQRTKGAITKLLKLSPDKALLTNGDIVTKVPTESLKIGDVVLVKSGAKIPLDGKVVRGTSGVDESMLTGESMPVLKKEGDEVIGGSINDNGILYIEITRIGRDTTLAKIVRFVEEAQGKKAPISQIADKVAGIFVPTVMAIAVISCIVWLILRKDINFALNIFTSVLVVACPCALGLATPTAIMVGTGLGASNGILIRSGEALEITHKVEVVVLDKTGTVTNGKPKVVKVVTNNCDENELIALAASVEAVSNHPLSKAIMQEAEDRIITEKFQIEKFENVTGKGIKACLTDKREVCIGNERLMKEMSIAISDLKNEALLLADMGNTPMYVAVDKKTCGIICVADEIKETSYKAIESLKQAGIKVVMITGDNKKTADYIARMVKVDEVFSEVMPEDKAKIVKEIQSQGKVVMMVGDGINDAPALTMADVGCAIGNGSDIAIESGNIVLMKNDLIDVYRAIRLSRFTIKNIKENLFWAFCYNIIGIPIAAGVLYFYNGMLLNPMLAGLFMSLSSVCVVTNALRLRRKKI